MKTVQRIIKRVDELMMLFGIWMADVAPLIFKPIKFWWADRMILACGFQDPDGKTVIVCGQQIQLGDIYRHVIIRVMNEKTHKQFL